MELYNFIKSLKNGSYMQVVACTEPKMLKKNNPYLNRVEKITLYSGVRTGVDYAVCVARAIERATSEGSEFVADAPKGMQWESFPKILKSIKDGSQLYFRISIDKSTNTKSYWLLDGRTATDTEVADIKNYLSAVSSSAKQAAAGLVNESDQIQVRSIKFQNILYVKQGAEREYRNEKRLQTIEQAVEQMPAM